MTVKKAMEDLDYVLKARKRFIEGLTDPLASWNNGDDVVSKMVKARQKSSKRTCYGCAPYASNSFPYST